MKENKNEALQIAALHLAGYKLGDRQADLSPAQRIFILECLPELLKELSPEHGDNKKSKKTDLQAEVERRRSRTKGR